MSRRRRVYGPLTYASLTIAGLFLIGMGLYSAWPSVRDRWDRIELRRDLDHPSPRTRRAAVTRLAVMGADSAEILAGAIRDGEADVRGLACKPLAGSGASYETIAPALLSAIDDPDPTVRLEAVEALGLLRRERGMESSDHWGTEVDAIRVTVGDPNARVRLTAILTLREFGLDARSTVPTLESRLDDPEWEVRLEAARTLLAIASPDHRGAQDCLLDAVCDPLGPPLYLRAWALESIQVRLNEATDRLVESLRNPTPELRRGAAWRLGLLSSHVSLPRKARFALLAAVLSPNPWLRDQAASALLMDSPVLSLLAWPGMVQLAERPANPPKVRESAGIWLDGLEWQFRGGRIGQGLRLLRRVVHHIVILRELGLAVANP